MACQCVKKPEELGLQKKRAQDENYRNDDDPDPNPLPFPLPGPGPHGRPGGKPGEKPKIATLFNH